MKVTNTVNSPLGLPNGPVVFPQTTVLVPDWESKASNAVVKAWVEAGALKLTPVSEKTTEPVTNTANTGGDANANTDPAAGAGKTGAGEGAGNEDARADEFRAMTIPELSALITENGGTVKAGLLKEDLVTMALEVVKV